MSGDRPEIHFTARSGWINDPLAVTWRDGRYHLFFQHVPGSVTWAPACHWGHATSTDLLRWTEQQVALAPGDGDEGVWSGGIADGTIFYTSVPGPRSGIGRIRRATASDDSWRTWRKGDVVIDAPPDGVRMFRDPFVHRDGDGWSMLVGAGLDDGDAAVLAYRSADLLEWSFEGIAARRSTALRDPVWTGSGWECPQLIGVDGRDVLVVSVWDDDRTHYVACTVGRWSAGRFEAGPWQRLTIGDGYYAATAFRDADDRPCLIHWIRGVEGDGWAGALSVPHLLTIEDDRLVARAHPVVAGQVTLDPGPRDDPPGIGPAHVLRDGPITEVWTAEGVIALVG